jgi:hypothetical protein
VVIYNQQKSGDAQRQSEYIDPGKNFVFQERSKSGFEVVSLHGRRFFKNVPAKRAKKKSAQRKT